MQFSLTNGLIVAAGLLVVALIVASVVASRPCPPCKCSDGDCTPAHCKQVCVNGTPAQNQLCYNQCVSKC